MPQEPTNAELRDLIVEVAKKQDNFAQKQEGFAQKLDDVAKKQDDTLHAVNEFATNTEQRLQANEENINLLKQGQDEIKLRLSHSAQRFEIEDLNRRVVQLERNAGLT